MFLSVLRNLNLYACSFRPTPPGQMIGVIPHAEDGLYSRFLFLTQPVRYEWISGEPGEEEIDTEKLFLTLGSSVLNWHQELLKRDTSIRFTQSQWQKHTHLFNKLPEEIALEHKTYASAILFRYGVMTMRIAAILTTLRQCEDQLWSGLLQCSDTDMDTAFKIALTCLEHSLLLSSSLNPGNILVKPLTSFRKQQIFWDKLPDFFTYTEMLQIAEECGISKSSAKRPIKRAIEDKKLEHKEKVYKKRPGC